MLGRISLLYSMAHLLHATHHRYVSIALLLLFFSQRETPYDRHEGVWAMSQGWPMGSAAWQMNHFRRMEVRRSGWRFISWIPPAWESIYDAWRFRYGVCFFSFPSLSLSLSLSWFLFIVALSTNKQTNKQIREEQNRTKRNRAATEKGIINQ